jgi:Protein of unknown function (DUF2628)
LPTYTIHEPPEPGADRIDRASDLKFVKDGFAWLTALFPPLGLALSRLWLPLLAYVVFVGAGVAGLQALGVDSSGLCLLVVALHIYLGFEHSTLERWVLDNAGWQTLGSVTGKTLAEAERRFFESWLPAQPMIATGPGRIKNGEVMPPKRMPWTVPRIGA